MNESEFVRLLDLYKKNLLSPEQKKMMEDWFHQLDMGADATFSNIDKSRLKQNILAQVRNSEVNASAGEHSFSERQASRGNWWKIAASISIVLLVGFVAWRVAFTGRELYTYTSEGTIRKVTLSDGSLVWLKGNSSLQAPLMFDGEERRVTLQGEALFEVAKDPHHPFIIQCGQVTTKVLGTSFNLKSFDSSVELTVLSGKVSLASDDNAKEVVVLPNEKVMFDAAKSLVSKTKVAIEEKSATTEGTEYEMSFNDVPLGQVFGRIEKKFDVTISLSAEDLRDCIIRADFSDQSLEKTLDMICQSLDFRYTIDRNEVRITGESCN